MPRKKRPVGDHYLSSEELFEQYTQAESLVNEKSGELSAWKRLHPQGDPGGLAASFGDAVKRRDELKRKLQERNFLFT